MNIYKIEQFENTKDLAHIDATSEEIEMLEKVELNQLIIEDNGTYIIGLFDNEYINLINFLFNKYQIKFSITDITSQFINTTPFANMFKSKEDQIKSFIFNNMSVNDVLDKINTSGMESLNEIDYIILNK